MTETAAHATELPRFKLESRALTAAPADWSAVLAAASIVPPAYTTSWIEYQSAYVRGAADELVDHSRTIFVDGKPVAVWPVSLVRNATAWRLRSQEASVRAPLFTGPLPEITRKRIIDACWEWMADVAAHYGIAEVATLHPIRGGPLDEWHRKTMENGSVARLRHGLYVDLSMPREDAWLRVRKSYRPLVNKGKSLWRTEIIDSDRPDVMEEFHALHREAAGRETRSAETWAVQTASLASGDSFLVVIRAPEGRMVGGALFPRSRTEAFYGVGAYDRALFEHPLGHVVQWEAICYMQDRGLRWYYIGERPYPGDDPQPSEKQLAIGRFQEGFATHFFPHLEMRRAMRAPVPESS